MPANRSWKVTGSFLGLLIAGCLTGCFDELLPSDQGSDEDTWEEVNCDTDSANAEVYPQECIVLAIVNQNRAQGANCGSEGQFDPTPPLVMNGQLLEAARLHSEDMGERNYFSHDSPGGPNGNTMTDRVENAGYSNWMAIGENIACGLSSPEQTMQGWMDSDGHCANIMNPSFKEIGVGYARVDNSNYIYYWTQDFGAR